MSRGAFSLIELVAALIAASVLIAGLGATLAVSTQLLESPADDTLAWQDHEIADRIAADLRYARQIQDNPGDGFQVVRPHPQTGLDETVTYLANDNGLTRQLAQVPVAVLAPATPDLQFSVIQPLASTNDDSLLPVRVHSCNQVASAAAVTNLVIDVPPGCRPNDLLLLGVSSRADQANEITLSDWQIIDSRATSDLRLTIAYRIFDANTPASTTITATDPASISAVMVSVENTDVATPIAWHANQAGYAIPFLSFTLPSVLQSASITPPRLSVQVIAAQRRPWPAGSIGLASYVDLAQTTAAEGSFLNENSLAIIVRNGPLPSLSFTPRVLYSQYTYWTVAGVEFQPEASP